MVIQIVTKNQNKLWRYEYPLRIKRNIENWEALAGIWREKKIKEVLRWQKNIRREWERKLPTLK